MLWAGAAHGEEVVWVEGESAFLDNFNNHGWYGGDNVARDRLSPGTPGSVDGDWLVHYSPGGEEAEATYALDLTEGGQYTLWVRANGFNPNLSVSVAGQARTPTLSKGCASSNYELCCRWLARHFVKKFSYDMCKSV